jgi:hypothetical protein
MPLKLVSLADINYVALFLKIQDRIARTYNLLQHNFWMSMIGLHCQVNSMDTYADEHQFIVFHITNILT